MPVPKRTLCQILWGLGLVLLLVPTHLSPPAQAQMTRSEDGSAWSSEDSEVPFFRKKTNASALDPSRLQWRSCAGILEKDLAGRECAEFMVPLCYEPTCSNATELTLKIERFEGPNAANTPTIWIEQIAQDDIDDIITVLLRQGLNIYTLKNRISDFPRLPGDCQNVGVENRGGRVQIDSQVLTNTEQCRQGLRDRYGEHYSRGFTLDAAARDLATAIRLVQEQVLGHNPTVYVHGIGRGAWIAQRLLAMDGVVKNVAGYILDAPVPMSITTQRDLDYDVAAKTLLGSCEDDETCRAKFKSRKATPREVVAAIYSTLDAAAAGLTELSSCLSLLQSRVLEHRRVDTASQAARHFFAMLMQHRTASRLLLPLLFRLHRCDSDDKSAVDHFIDKFFRTVAQDVARMRWGRVIGSLRFTAMMLEMSEIWARPVRPLDELVQSFTNVTISDGLMVWDFAGYCLLSGAQSPDCQRFYTRGVEAPKLPSMLTNTSKSASALPSTIRADVMILASRVNPVATSAFTRSLYDQLDAATANSKNHTTTLIATDSPGVASTLLGDDGAAIAVVVRKFVSGPRAAGLHGRWRIDDFRTGRDPRTSTLDSSPVRVTLGVDSDVSFSWLYDEDPYESTGLAVAKFFVPIVFIILKWAAVIVLVIVAIVVAIICYQRRQERRRLEERRNAANGATSTHAPPPPTTAAALRNDDWQVYEPACYRSPPPPSAPALIYGQPPQPVTTDGWQVYNPALFESGASSSSAPPQSRTLV